MNNTTVNAAALSTGDLCTLNFTLANNTGPTYGISAECHDIGGGRLFYHSGAHAIGSPKAGFTTGGTLEERSRRPALLARVEAP